MALNRGIALSQPDLGSIVSSMSPSVVIAPVNADRPYIMGSVVAGLAPSASKESTKAFIGAPSGKQKLQGVMCLGIGQIKQRSKDGFVRDGFASDYNNYGTQGAFWCALDLQHFDKIKIVNGAGVLSVDVNGVLSFSDANITGNTAGGTATANVEIDNSNASALNYYASPIISAIDETIVVGANTYTFKYPNGIGAILLVIR